MSAAPVMVLAGGTGGHIFPGLAVARELRALGVSVVWLGAQGGMETRLVSQEHIVIDTLRISSLRGRGLGALLLAPFRLLRALWSAIGVLRLRRPRCVISFGGFAAGPGGLAAWCLGLPLLVHEQNRAPGLTNRVLAKLACRVMTGFPNTFARAAEVVGNPVRPDIAAVLEPTQRLADRLGRVRVLVLGGSQGAQTLNRRLPVALQNLPLIIRHQCGEPHLEATRKAYIDAGVDAEVMGFIADMALAYAWADLVICRAGASTLSELCAVGLGAVLIPLPTAADDHQTRNADYLCEQGAAIRVSEGDGFESRLRAVLEPVLQSPLQRLAMAQAARRLAHTDAAKTVAMACLDEARV